VDSATGCRAPRSRRRRDRGHRPPRHGPQFHLSDPDGSVSRSPRRKQV